MTDSVWPKRLVTSKLVVEREEVLLNQMAERLGIPVVYTTPKLMGRGRTPITRDDLVTGDIKLITQALHQLGVAVPKDNSYPTSLHPWLGRKVTWRRSLAEVLFEVEHRGTSVFVKPADNLKRFTGFVLSHDTLWRGYGVSKSRPVWTSEPIVILSEWRVYVAEGVILHTAHYDKDRLVRPDTDVIEEAVAAYESSGEAPHGYAIDFCIDNKGRTLLIECNGGFSVGAYGSVSAEDYWRMATAYWKQLVTAE